MEKSDNFLGGHFLIAMPQMRDERFARAVVYLCAHTEDGAMGIVVNQVVPNIALGDIIDQLRLISGEAELKISKATRLVKIHRGGPLEAGRGFVLHSSDYSVTNGTRIVDDNVSLTATTEVLEALASGSGPSKALLALGYAGWGPGILEAELYDNAWLTCPGDPAIIFNTRPRDKWKKALGLIGAKPWQLSEFTGLS